MTHPTSTTGQAIRTPRAPAVAGIAFSVLLTVVFVLVRVAVPSDPNDAGGWLDDGTNRDAVVLALNLLPFTGIAFLWFIGVVRDRIGEGEDRFFATVFLGSGLLFIAMLFATGAMAAALCGRRRIARGCGRSAAASAMPCSSSMRCGWVRVHVLAMDRPPRGRTHPGRCHHHQRAGERSPPNPG
jgi:hypothetical protein